MESLLTGAGLFSVTLLKIIPFMILAPYISVTRSESSKLNDLNLENIPFGKYFSDHMLEDDYEKVEWINV